GGGRQAVDRGDVGGDVADVLARRGVRAGDRPERLAGSDDDAGAGLLRTGADDGPRDRADADGEGESGDEARDGDGDPPARGQSQGRGRRAGGGVPSGGPGGDLGPPEGSGGGRQV